MRMLKQHINCQIQWKRLIWKIKDTNGNRIGVNYANVSSTCKIVKGEVEGTAGSDDEQDGQHEFKVEDSSGGRGTLSIVRHNNNNKNFHSKFKRNMLTKLPYLSKDVSLEKCEIISKEVDPVKKKIELLIRKNMLGNLNETVFQILSVINEHPRNKNVYINKNLLISFHSLLIKKKYYLNIFKNNICDNFYMNIFDYIHHNINLHLRHYNLKNVSEFLPDISKYMHKIDPSKNTKELVTNIFYFHFFVYFNKFYYYRKRRNDIRTGDHYSNECRSNYYISKDEEVEYGHRKKDTNNYKQCNSLSDYMYDEIQKDREKCKWKEEISKRRGLIFGGDIPNGVMDNRIITNEKEVEFPQKVNKQQFDNVQKDEIIFYQLNRYVVFLSNHTAYANEKILHNISTLAKKVIEIGINDKLALSFLSSSMSIFNKLRGKYKLNILIYKKVNYEILHFILKKWGTKFGKLVENKATPVVGNFLHSQGSNKNDSLFQEEHSIEAASIIPFAFEKKSKNNNNSSEAPKMWEYSHIIHVINILKVKNLLYSQISFSVEVEEHLISLFNAIMNLFQDRFFSCMMEGQESFSQWNGARTQNELNSVILIYVNLSILLNELKNGDKLLLHILPILNKCHWIVHTYYYMLHENMIINIVRGIYHELLAYSYLKPFKSYFYQMEEEEEEEEEEPISFVSPLDKIQPHRADKCRGEELLVLKKLLHLAKDISNSFIFPIRDERKPNMNKLITVVHYLHKINKIFITFNTNDMLKMCILNFLKEIEKRVNNEEGELSNHNILIFLNIYLSHRSEKLNISLLHACFNYLNTNDSNLFEHETEIIMFLNFLKKFNDMGKTWNRSKCPLPNWNSLNFVFKSEGSSHDYEPSADADEMADTDRDKQDSFFLQRKTESCDRTVDSVNKMVTHLADKITKLLFFQKESPKLNSSRKSEKKPINEPIFGMNTSRYYPHISQFSRRTYPINVYFMAYENISSNYINEESTRETLLNYLTELVQHERRKLNEENFFFIISSLLKNRNLDHDIYFLYNEYLKSNARKVQMKYVFFVLKRIFEEFDQVKKFRKHASAPSCIHMEAKKNEKEMYSDGYPLLNIIRTSCNLILCDKRYQQNFSFLKEILHVYFEKYPNLGDIIPEVNMFVLTHFNTFVNCKEKLNENELVRIIYNISSFYYTINRYSYETNKKLYLINTSIDEKKETLKIGKDACKHMGNTVFIADRVEDVDREPINIQVPLLPLSSTQNLTPSSESSYNLTLLPGLQTSSSSSSPLSQHNILQKETKQTQIKHRCADNYDSHGNRQHDNFPNWEKNIINYNEHNIKNKLIKQLNCLLDTLYSEKIKRGIKDHIKLTSSNIIHVLISLKNAKIRHTGLIHVLSKWYISYIFSSKKNEDPKLELQIRFFNSVVFLDSLEEINKIFQQMDPCQLTVPDQPQTEQQQIEHPCETHEKKKLIHVFYAHFIQLPIQALYTPNITSYLLNFISIVDYMPMEHQRRGCWKVIIWIHELVKIFFPYKVVDSKCLAHFSRNVAKCSNKYTSNYSPITHLDKRNIFFLLTLLPLGKYPNVHVSSFPLDFLKRFYNNFIRSDLSYLNNSRVRSSSTHQSIYEFVHTFLKKELTDYDIYNETQVLFYKVDIVIRTRGNTTRSSCFNFSHFDSHSKTC
ncbi:hypothetical protein, conserved [Plasmodium gonderi]|uniref:Uncharacterized protein n=1 Tax=Plasmodium gonderi TaxID=77519 RepID=A0A1Y1JHH1_PLAGO|nr:hypothetical protein, conserved [Plasmodium gonderi]GAW79524.1 hypothetical protein, conserved [Plasmodium gonderi]